MAASRKHYGDEVVLTAVELFLRGESAPEIAKKLNDRFGESITREQVYVLMKAARERGMLQVVGPQDASLARGIAERFRCDADSITVVCTDADRRGGHVAAAAADAVLELLKAVAKKKRAGEVVGLGLGPGPTMLAACEALGRLIRTDPEAPDSLKLFSLVCGTLAYRAKFEPTSFFNLFPASHVRACVGMFAPIVVRQSELEGLKSLPGVCEAFAERGEIDVVFASIGELADARSVIGKTFERSGRSLDFLDERGDHAGLVLHRPYSATGAITQKGNQWRALSLFEVSELTSFAGNKDKYVVLVANQARECGADISGELVPILANPDLRFWNRLVLDVATARGLLKRGNAA